MNFCPECGNKRYNLSKYCFECGFDFSSIHSLQENASSSQCPYCKNDSNFSSAHGGKVALKVCTEWAINPRKGVSEVIGIVAQFYKDSKADKVYAAKEFECSNCQRIIFKCGKCGTYVKWEQKLKPCPTCGITIC